MKRIRRTKPRITKMTQVTLIQQTHQRVQTKIERIGEEKETKRRRKQNLTVNQVQILIHHKVTIKRKGIMIHHKKKQVHLVTLTKAKKRKRTKVRIRKTKVK